MNILVTGATGFIAAEIIAKLIAAGHQVVGCVRDTAYAACIFPQMTIIKCDFMQDTDPATWLPRLQNIDVVINCVGIFYHPDKKKMWAIHYETPKALFAASVTVGVKKIIQISALGVDQSDVEYAKSKKASEDELQTLPIASVILRPSFVYSQGTYGGSSLFRGLAGLPFVTPIPGGGKQLFQPIYLPDLAHAILQLVENQSEENAREKLLLKAVGPEKISLREILQKTRAWLGFPRTIILSIPLFFIKIAAFFGDFIPYSGMNVTAYKMMKFDNVASSDDTKEFFKHIQFTPRNFQQGLQTHPSTVQDHWHAKLFFLKRALQFSLAFIWLWSALCSAFFYPKALSFELLQAVGITSYHNLFLYSAALLDALIGIAILFNYQSKKIGWLQLAVVIFYTLLITLFLPQFWLHPFAPIAKNIPLMVAILIYLAWGSDR